MNHFVKVLDAEKFSMIVNNKIYPTVIQVRKNTIFKEEKGETETNSSIFPFFETDEKLPALERPKKALKRYFQGFLKAPSHFPAS